MFYWPMDLQATNCDLQKVCVEAWQARRLDQHSWTSADVFCVQCDATICAIENFGFAGAIDYLFQIFARPLTRAVFVQVFSFWNGDWVEFECFLIPARHFNGI